MLVQYCKDFINSIAETYREIKYHRILKSKIDPYYFNADNELSYLKKANIRLKYLKAPTPLRDELKDEFGEAADYLPYSYLEMRLTHHEFKMLSFTGNKKC